MKGIEFVLHNLKGKKLQYVMTLVLVAVNAFLPVVPTVVIGKIVDNVLYNKLGLDTADKTTLLWKYVILLVLATLVYSLVRYFNTMSCAKIALYVSQNIRARLYEKLQTLDLAFYSKNASGELISQMTTDINVIYDFFASIGYRIVSDVMNIVFTFYVLISNSVPIALSLFLFVPFIILTTSLLHKKTRMLHRNLRDKFSEMNGYVNENLGAYRVVKAFAREDHEIERLTDYSEQYRNMAIDNTKKRTVYATPMHLVAEIMRVFALVSCGIMILCFPQSGVTVGSLTVFTSLIFTIVARFRDLSVIISWIQQVGVSINKVTNLYNTEPDIDNVHHIQSKDGKIHKIEFKDVTLVLDGQTILDKVSFKVYGGQTLAIMGPTGAGKTILISMLLRLYDPTDGVILINNIDIRDYDLGKLRKMIALSTQDVFLFSDTIDGNIAYSDPDMPIEQVKAFAECAQASDFIEKLTEGYDTIIGERGVGLSGGQRQRIALARAVAKKSSLIILDDTTSAVDAETESLIIKELAKIENKIKIIVAQRITSVVGADKILVIEDGKITEQGTHDQLVAAGGYYTSIYNIAQKGSTEVNL